MSLPNDVSRCLGRRDWTPETDTCQVRNTCQRYLAAASGDFGQYGRAPWYLWMCETEHHVLRIPVEKDK
jgi:hypothetical protein